MIVVLTRTDEVDGDYEFEGSLGCFMFAIL